MVKLEKIEYSIKQILLKEVDIPNEYYNMISKTLQNIDTNKEVIKEKILKIFIGLITGIIGMSGICFASVKVYDKYIKQQMSIQSKSLIESENNITDYDNNLLHDMNYDEKSNLYFKVIDNFKEYKIYKEKVQNLYDLNEDDFYSKSLLIVTWDGNKELHERNLMVDDITVDNEITYINLKPKEKLDKKANNNIILAIVAKEQLKGNIKIKVKYKKIESSQFVRVEELPDNYSVEDATKDGCIVIENNKLKSNNLKLLDEFIEKTEHGENSILRVYSKEKDDDDKVNIYIKDVEFKDEIYYVNTNNIINKKEQYFHSYEKLVKQKTRFGISYTWVEHAEDIEDGNFESYPFVLISN